MLETFTVQKQIGWEMGHRLSLHKGKCHNLHGHSYKGEIVVESSGLNVDGMVTDFYNFGPIKEWIDRYLDHAFMLNAEDPILERMKEIANADNMKLMIINFEPTAENIAKMLLIQSNKLLRSQLRHEHVFTVRAVQVWETPNSSATYIDRTVQLPDRF